MPLEINSTSQAPQQNRPNSTARQTDPTARNVQKAQAEKEQASSETRQAQRQEQKASNRLQNAKSAEQQASRMVQKAQIEQQQAQQNNANPQDRGAEVDVIV